MNEEVLVSVILPVYNVEDYLDECLLSILNQSLYNIEVICIDDASEDNSYQILEYYSKEDLRIRVFKNSKNIGLGATRNKALKFARGKYIQYVDSDDWITPDSLEKSYTLADKLDLDMLIYKAINYNQQDNSLVEYMIFDMEFLEKYENEIFNIDNLSSKEIFSMSVNAWNKLYKREFLIKNNFKYPINLYYEDIPSFYYIFAIAKRVSFINNYQYVRRIHPDAITQNNSDYVFDTLDIIKELVHVLNENTLLNKYPADVLDYIATLLSRYLKLIDNQLKDDYFTGCKNLLKNLLTDTFKDVDKLNINIKNKEFIDDVLESENFSDFLKHNDNNLFY